MPGCIFEQRPRQESNLRSHAPEARALSTELRGLWPNYSTIVNDISFPLTIAIPTATLEQMIKVGGTWAMTQTPQFNNFTTQPLDALAQQPSQGQFALETEFDDIPESFTPNYCMQEI